MSTTDMMSVVTNPCIVCGLRSKLEVDSASYMKWLGGELIQNAFPTMSTGTRELLKMGTHSACFDGMFKEEDK